MKETGLYLTKIGDGIIHSYATMRTNAFLSCILTHANGEMEFAGSELVSIRILMPRTSYSGQRKGKESYPEVTHW